MDEFKQSVREFLNEANDKLVVFVPNTISSLTLGRTSVLQYFSGALCIPMALGALDPHQIDTVQQLVNAHNSLIVA